MGRFETQLIKPQRLWTAFAACPLPPSIALRLTMARVQAPALYEHSLRAAFVALFIGLSARFAENDLHVLASAALLHDIGMQHIDPTQFDV